MEFKSIDEYYKEFINTGKESFYDFLEEKLQEAQNNGNQELADYIEGLQMDVANQEFYEMETKRIQDEERKNWTGYNYGDENEEVSIDSDNIENIEGSDSLQPENADKEELLDELSDVKYYLSELENKMNVEDFQEQYESFEIEDMNRERQNLKARIEEIESEIYMIEMGELGTSLTSMIPDEIKKQYEKLLEKRESYKQMAEDGHEVDNLEWKINSGLIEMIEEYIKANLELSEFVQPSNDEIEALLAKEMKSKSARDAGFEVNEFGEIIRPSKPLGEINTEDLSKLEEEMDQEIDANNEKIKQAQIDRLLAKQKIIREQRKTLKELEGQAIDFDD